MVCYSLYSGHGPTIYSFRMVTTCLSIPGSADIGHPIWDAPAPREQWRLGFLALWWVHHVDQTESPAVVHSLSLRHRKKLNWLCMGCSSPNLLVVPYTLGFSRWWQIDCLMIYTQEPQTLLLRLEFLTQILSLELFFRDRKWIPLFFFFLYKIKGTGSLVGKGKMKKSPSPPLLLLIYTF